MHSITKFLTAILQRVDDSKLFNDEGRISLRVQTHYHIEHIRISSSMNVFNLLYCSTSSRNGLFAFFTMDRGYRCRSYVCILSIKDIDRSLKR